MQYLLGIMMFLTALFLILLVLIQRGRGGGLAGAFGGAGGQSAFGTKAGDMFTKITIGPAAIWILIAALSVRLLNAPKSSVLGDGDAPPTSISPLGPLDDDGTGDAGDTGVLGDALKDAGLLKDTDGGTTPPATETPATETPATSTPATETPATETPATTSPPADPPPGE